MPILYGGKVDPGVMATFEVLDVESGTWILLSPQPFPAPPVSKARPFISLTITRPGVLLYYDRDLRNVWLYSAGRWGKVDVTLTKDDYRGGTYTLLPRDYICSG